MRSTQEMIMFVSERGPQERCSESRSGFLDSGIHFHFVTYLCLCDIWIYTSRLTSYGLPLFGMKSPFPQHQPDIYVNGCQLNRVCFTLVILLHFEVNPMFSPCTHK